jgi:hypothetical protein
MGLILFYLFCAILFFIALLFLTVLHEENRILEKENEELIRDNKFYAKKNHFLAYQKETLSKRLEAKESELTDLKNRLN